MKKLTFLCIIVLLAFVIGCNGRIDLLELASFIEPESGKEVVTDIDSPSVDLPVLEPKILIKSSDNIEILIDDTYTFPDTEAFAYMTQTFIIENTGDVDLNIGNIIFIDIVNMEIINDFSITNAPDSIVLPGELTTFDVTFMSTTEGLTQGLMIIGSDDVVYRIFLDVTVTIFTFPYPDIDIMIDSYPMKDGDLYFVQDTLVGEIRVINVTISNFGGEDLLLNNIFIPAAKGVFIIGPPTEDKVPPMSFITFQIAFYPVEIETYTKKLKINTNDPIESSFTIYLTGNGI